MEKVLDPLELSSSFFLKSLQTLFANYNFTPPLIARLKIFSVKVRLFAIVQSYQAQFRDIVL